MDNIKYYNIQFLGNCADGPNIRVHIPKGLTESQLNDWKNEFEEIQTVYGKDNDDDFSEFSIHDAIKSSAEKLNIEFEYPKVDYTIYI